MSVPDSKISIVLLFTNLTEWLGGYTICMASLLLSVLPELQKLKLIVVTFIHA